MSDEKHSGLTKAEAVGDLKGTPIGLVLLFSASLLLAFGLGLSFSHGAMVAIAIQIIGNAIRMDA